MAKHKYIETPEKLLELFKGYSNEVKSNPRKKHVFVGKDGKSEYELLERPLTYEGFSVYCFNEIGSIKHYFENRDDSYTEYVPICTHIKQMIRNDQIDGGMVGQYNPSITQRLNGLVEKTDNKNENTNIDYHAGFNNALQPPSQPSKDTQ
jgi:hypothetical protein